MHKEARASLRILAWGVVLILFSEGAMAAKRDFDASDVTWAHAVNSKDMLEKELSGNVDFLEADVVLGMLKGNQFGTIIPIMAHPPHNVSDISLEEWLDMVIRSNTGKGVKLDFKVLDVVEPSLDILRRRNVDQLNSTIWLNADILPGPVHAPSVPPMEDMFMFLCHQYFPDALLSIGWTTEWYPTYPKEMWHYDWHNVRKMSDTIRRFFPDTHSQQNFTFPVRGIFASRSIEQLQWLLTVVPGSTLTVWTVSGIFSDPLEVGDLVRIRKSFPKDKVYFDLPVRLREEFEKVKNNVSFNPTPTIGGDHWMILKKGIGHECSSNTYITNDTVMFGKSMYTAVLLKKLLVTDDKKDLKIRGKFEFFGDGTPKKNKVSIVLVDVSLFSKNMTLDLTGSDSDVLWTALNASHVYTFEEMTSSGHCRVFSLDTSRDRSFQAWTVHCDDMRESGSFEEMTSKGVQEISGSRRLVLPKLPAMIGFVSSGDSYVVLSGLEIGEGDRTEHVSASSVVEVSLGVLSMAFFSIVMRRIFT